MLTRITNFNGYYLLNSSKSLKVNSDADSLIVKRNNADLSYDIFIS